MTILKELIFHVFLTVPNQLRNFVRTKQNVEKRFPSEAEAHKSPNIVISCLIFVCTNCINQTIVLKFRTSRVLSLNNCCCFF